MNQDLEEYFFPKWEELKNIAYNLIDSEKSDSNSLDMVLLIMALDNEEEYITDYLADKDTGDDFNCSDKYIEMLSKRAITFPQPHARWQIAEVLRRRKTKDSLSLLQELMQDNNEYVKKRATYSYHNIRNT